MPILKSKYATQDEIPEWAHELYEERGGEWLLKKDAIEGVKTDADVQRVQRALNEATTKGREAKAALDKLGDRAKDIDKLLADLDEVEDLRARAEAAGAGGDKASEEAIQKRVDAAVATKTKPLERQIATLTTERDTLKGERDDFAGQLRRTKVEGALRDVAGKAGIVPHAIDDVLLYGERTFEVGDDGKIVTRDGIGVLPGLEPEAWLSEMLERKPHWKPRSDGGGATGGRDGNAGKPNPFTKAQWNRTQQTQMPSDQADRLAKQAGFRDLAHAIEHGQPIEPVK